MAKRQPNKIIYLFSGADSMVILNRQSSFYLNHSPGVVEIAPVDLVNDRFVVVTRFDSQQKPIAEAHFPIDSVGFEFTPDAPKPAKKAKEE